MRHERLAEPWLSFLTDRDLALDGPSDFHCISGFGDTTGQFFAGLLK